MVQYQLKLRMTKAQEAECARWLYHLTAVWNWAVRKIELNAKDKIYFPKRKFQNLLAFIIVRSLAFHHTFCRGFCVRCTTPGEGVFRG